MALTKIHSGQSFVSFIQPEIGGEISIKVDVQIDWIHEGYYVHIPQGGIYRVISAVVFNYILQLIKPEKEAGEMVSVDVIHPVPPYEMLSESSVIKHINWNGGSQIFDIGEQYVDNTLKIWVNGQLIVPPQYNPFGFEGKFEILDQLQSIDKIVIEYYIL